MKVLDSNDSISIKKLEARQNEIRDLRNRADEMIKDGKSKDAIVFLEKASRLTAYVDNSLEVKIIGDDSDVELRRLLNKQIEELRAL